MEMVWIRPILLVTAFAAIACSVSIAAEEDPVKKNLAAAKEEYQKTKEKARTQLLADLKKKAEAAQKAGDLKTLEKILIETEAYEKSGELPKSVPVKTYESLMRTARAKMEDEYGVTVRLYTKDGKIVQAKAVQLELDEFKKEGPVTSALPGELFQEKSVWVNAEKRITLTVIERKGDKFKARFEHGPGYERALSGTVKDGLVSWLAKDVRAVRGTVGGDNYGKFGSDKEGEKIDFEWKEGNDRNGTYTLRISKGK